MTLILGYNKLGFVFEEIKNWVETFSTSFYETQIQPRLISFIGEYVMPLCGDLEEALELCLGWFLLVHVLGASVLLGKPERNGQGGRQLSPLSAQCGGHSCSQDYVVSYFLLSSSLFFLHASKVALASYHVRRGEHIGSTARRNLLFAMS